MNFISIEPSILDEGYKFEGSSSPEAKLTRVISRWISSYLCQPHSKLGRAGPVCPFTELAVRLRQIWIAIAPKTDDTLDKVAAASLIGRDFFKRAPESKEASRDFKAVLVVFPHLNTPKGHSIIVDVQRSLKPQFVSDGLMFGQFYQRCPEPGLANPIFRPLSSPVPLLAIRYMVESDIAFLRDPDMSAHYARRFPSTSSSMDGSDAPEGGRAPTTIRHELQAVEPH